MRLETVPLILGALIGLVGLGLILDAWLTDHVQTERRRRPRRSRDRFGEFLVGLGTLAMALAFMGRDTWKYSTVAVIAGAVLLLWGLKRNLPYLRETYSREQQRRVSPPIRHDVGVADEPSSFVPGPRRLR